MVDHGPIGPRADRVAEIRCAGGRFGTGYLLSHDLVLTAAHVIEDLGKQPACIAVIEVTPLHGQTSAACLVWPRLSNWENLSQHDIALLRISSDAVMRALGDAPRIGWQGLPTDRPLNVTAVGFPRLRRNPKNKTRDTEQLFGTVNPLSALKRNEFEICAVHHRDIDADWHGLSGAALFAGRNLIGIVLTKVSDDRQIDFKAICIDAPEEDQEFRALIHGLRTRLHEPQLGIARSVWSATKTFRDEYLAAETGEVPFGGRDHELRRLNAWVFDTQSPPRMLITAPAGRGKSALLVQWIKSLEANHRFAEGGWQLAFMPISNRSGTNTSSVFYAGLAQRLAEILGQWNAPGLIQSTDTFKYEVQEQLETIASTGQRTLVVVDGLDEAVPESFDASIVPIRLPPTLRVVL